MGTSRTTPERPLPAGAEAAALPTATRSTRPVHTISGRALAQLASGHGDTETLRTLRDGQRSKRLLLLRMVYDAATSDPAVMGPLPPAEAAWELLTRARQADPAAFETVVMYPSIGVWASRVLRRIRGGVSASLPMWWEAGHLHNVSVAVAALADIDFRAQVPVREDRSVHLPSLGAVRLPGHSAAHRPGASVANVRRLAGGAVSVTLRGACVLIPADPRREAPGWSPLPRTSAAGAPDPHLDDADPYAGFIESRPPHRLGPSRTDRWRSLLGQATDLVRCEDAETADGLALLIRSIVPLAPATNDRPFSASSPEAFGGVMMALPQTATTLAVALIHEYQHLKLSALLDMVSLHHEGGTGRYYAPWRKDPRPIAGLLQGAYAHLGIVRFWRHRRSTARGPDARRAGFEYALWRDATARVLHDVRDCAELTDLGRWFVAGMRAAMAPWCAEALPSRVAADARSLARAHRTAWRLRNTQPEPGTSEALARSWSAGRPAPGTAVLGAPVLRPDAGRSESSSLPRLLQSRWDNPDEFAWRCRHPTLSGISRADLAYAQGEFAEAAVLYATDVATRPDAGEAWVGLAMASAAAGHDAAARPLLERPDVVRGVYLQLVAESGDMLTDPLQLACWVGLALPPAVSKGASED
ncbi:MAG TPA: HEXXH motif domain-containing protein [Yinghuangia sp.]|nr:HEXXH motif domain-containing protein [Yinghuangia sp.]